MNVLNAVIAGVVASLVFSFVLMMAPKMGMPKMDIVSLLGSMFSPQTNLVVGWMMHLMMGIVFGALQWLIVGLVMGMIPMMHAGIKSGAVKAPGLWMTNNGGVMAFMGGLVGHMIFGIVIALAYSAL